MLKPFEYNELATSESLSKKVVKGGVWVFSLRILNRGLGFIRTIILARLLAPEDFGLMGIAMLSISTLETFSQTGFQAALIQKNENIESYLDTAWTVSAIRGLILFLILFFTAPLIAEFFNSPQATLIIRVIAVSTLFSGLSNIGMILFQKELEFNKLFFYELSATVVDLGVAVTLAFLLRNVWALVWGGLAANFVRLFMSYIIQQYRPRIGLDKEKFHELLSFGKWVLGSSILVFLITQGDDILVGKMLGITALGLYQMAYHISNLPATEITHVISRLTFPAYSKLQDDLPKLKEAYLKVLQVTAFISIPLAGGIFILAPEFTRIFLGNKWTAMVPPMQVLVMSGLVRSIQATTGPVFLAVNRPNIEPKWQVIRLIVLVVLIYPFTIYWGIFGASVAVFLSTFISTLGFSFMVLNITECGISSFFKMIAYPFINALIMVLILLIFKNNISVIEICHFMLLIGVGILMYLCMSYLADKVFNYNILRVIKDCFVIY
jgi:lipopolysaccharide exporter